MSATGVARSQRRSMRHRSRAQAADLVLDLQFSLLEAADGIVIGMRSGIFLDDRMLQRSMLGFQRFDVVHSAHRRPPSWLRTVKILTPRMRRVTPNRAPRRAVHKSARMVRMTDPSRPTKRLIIGISGASGVIYGVRL